MNNIKSQLLDIIEREQVAFQFGDGLICFTKTEEECGSSDLNQELQNEVKEMRLSIYQAKSISKIDKESLLDDRLGFAEFASWSNENDTLILVDNHLLICIPRILNWAA